MNTFNLIVKASFEQNPPKQTFENKKCILLVSVGQKYHEAERLAATIDLINQHQFKSCTIAVADTLQRHNYINKTLDEAYDHALQQGEDWLIRNANIIEKLQPTIDILKWDDALNDNDYTLMKGLVESEYHKKQSYYQAINSTIMMFIDRVKKRDAGADLDRLFSNCLNYLIEECPIIMPLWASQGYDYVIYPKPMTNAMSKTYDLFVNPFYADKGNWLSLKFKKSGTFN